MEITQLTPELAQTLLDESTILNRSISPRDVNKYVADMKAGHWTIPTGMLLSEEHGLLDGFHRCSAVVKSGCTIPVYILPGTVAMFNEIDQGTSRTLGGVLTTRGYQNTVATGSGIINVLGVEYAYKTESFSTNNHPDGGRNYTMREKLKVLDRRPDLPEDVQGVMKAAEGRTVTITKGILIAMRNISRTVDLVEEFDDFVSTVARGENTSSGDATFAVRRRLLQHEANRSIKMGSKMVAALWVKGWNLHVEGAEVRLVKPPLKKFPLPFGTDEWMNQG